jgi:hypothetical protein
MHRALHVAAGKQGQQSLVAASNCNNSPSRLYVTDWLSKMSFLVDTGVDLCVLNFTSGSYHKPPAYKCHFTLR